MSAREYFDSVAAAVRLHRHAELQLLYGPPSGNGGGGSSSDHSDPVAARALSNEAARADLSATETVIGEALERIEGLRGLFGDKADVIEAHFVDLAPWTDVAADFGVTERTVRRWYDGMCEFADSVGWARVLLGEGFAEG